jgi:hypothetical protein
VFCGRWIVSQLCWEGGPTLAGICSVLWFGIDSCKTCATKLPGISGIQNDLLLNRAYSLLLRCGSAHVGVSSVACVQIFDGRMPDEKKCGYRDRNTWSASCTQASVTSKRLALTGEAAMLEGILQSMVCCTLRCSYSKSSAGLH